MSELGKFSVTFSGDMDSLCLPPPARRALAAIHQGRCADARRHVSSLKTDDHFSSRYWEALLEGLVAAQEEAEDLEIEVFFCAAGYAFAAGYENSTNKSVHVSSTKFPPNTSARWAALAWELAGNALRRREQLNRALATHAAAYALRQEHGQVLECWESAMSAGQDAFLLREFEVSVDWFGQALARAEMVGVSGLPYQAEALSARTQVHMATGSIIKAIADARLARSSRQQHDPASVQVPRADLLVARALIKQVELSPDGTSAQSAELLSESMALLRISAESFAAFGPDYAPEARVATELLDFAIRISQTIAIVDSRTAECLMNSTALQSS